MTMRERMTALVKGEPHDRVPFAQYNNNLPNQEVWELCGRENVGLIPWVRAYRLDHPNCRIDTEPLQRAALRGERQTLITPIGSLTRTIWFEPAYGSAATEEHYVKTLADYAIVDAWLDDTVVAYTPEPYHEAVAWLGEDGIPLVACPRTPWQQLWIEWVNIADLCEHFADDEDRLMRTIGKMDRIARQVYDCTCRLRPLFAQLGCNVTAPMIGRDKFARFCVPHYRELADRLAEWDIPVYSHLDGDLKPLWDLIGGSGLRGIDSLSPPPDNDTSVADALRVWPEMRLHINFPSSVHLLRPEGIRRATREILAQGGQSGRLMIQLSENVPERVWRTSLPIIVEEIDAQARM